MPHQWTLRPLFWAMLSLPLLTFAATGCQRGPEAPEPSATKGVEKAQSIQPMVNAMAFTLNTTLSLPQAATFTQLDAPQKQALHGLLKRSTLRSHVFAAEGRLLILPAKNHPAAGMELLLDGPEDRLDVRLLEGRIIRLPAAALPDVLDCALPSLRGLGEDPMHGGLPRVHVEPLTQGSALWERWIVDAPLRYQRRDLGTAWSLRLRLTLDAKSSATANGPHITPLCPLIFPLALGIDEALAGLMLCPEEVFGWRFRLDNSDRESIASPRFETTVEAHGWQQIPKGVGRFEGRVNKAWRLPGPDEPGEQSLSAKDLATIRPPGAPGTLAVDNRSGLAALIYLDGALLGWVGSGRQMHFVGLPKGFFQVFATAPSGARAWGPKELYMPGTLTLD